MKTTLYTNPIYLNGVEKTTTITPVISVNTPSGSILLPNYTAPYVLRVPEGVTCLSLMTNANNGRPITLHIGVTPGKTYELSSTLYTLNGERQVIIRSQYKTWYKFGRIQASMPGETSDYYAEISWPDYSDKIDVQDY